MWLDRSQRSIVCGCDRCPEVRELVTAPADADAWITAHAQMHADDDARRALAAARARGRRRDTPASVD